MSQPSLSELFRSFLHIGLVSFGGPAAQIALLQRETVERRGWLDDDGFLRGLSFCMLLPGPEAMQLATYVGWRARGTLGGLIAGGLFVLPGAVVIAALSALYIAYGTQPQVQSAFVGIKAAVLAIVIAALARLARKALHGPLAWSLAIAAFVALFALSVPFPLVILAAGLVGALTAAPDAGSRPPWPARGGTARVVALWGGLWAVPLAALWLAQAEMLFELALFFGQLAITTFGGAYAVLAYMTQTVVQAQGWVTEGQMIDALGLAETTPGPLILVTQFVGHLAGHGAGGWALWLAAGLVTLWMTFVPCFLWIFAGAPYLEAIMARPRLGAALAAISAAVAGVMASLSLWFGVHVLFGVVRETALGPALLPVTLPLPAPASLDPVALACLALACGLLWGRNWPVPAVLGACVLAALGLSLGRAAL
jgi:chromate transporter